MRIIELDLMETKQLKGSVIQELFNGNTTAFVIRNFLSDPDLALILSKNHSFHQTKFEPSEGYTALPRPFGGILGKEHFLEGYKEEVNFFKDAPFKQFEEVFKSSIEAIQLNQEIQLASDLDEVSFSNSWFSIRELQPEQGRFDVHCGNYFIDWNEGYFKKNDQELEAKNHLAFLAMVQKPISNTDLIIYDAHWENYKTRKDLETLVNKAGEEVKITDIPSTRISLNAGDIIFFNESNFWHQVPIFHGTINRITFGGFISKFKEKSKYYFWA